MYLRKTFRYKTCFVPNYLPLFTFLPCVYTFCLNYSGSFGQGTGSHVLNFFSKSSPKFIASIHDEGSLLLAESEYELGRSQSSVDLGVGLISLSQTESNGQFSYISAFASCNIWLFSWHFYVRVRILNILSRLISLSSFRTIVCSIIYAPYPSFVSRLSFSVIHLVIRFNSSRSFFILLLWII